MKTNLLPEETPSSSLINRDSQHQGKDDLIIALLKSLLTFQKHKQLSLLYPYSCVFRLIIYSLIVDFRSNLSVGEVFREITPPGKANVLYCRNSGPFHFANCRSRQRFHFQYFECLALPRFITETCMIIT